ncbi:TIM barrel protein [Brevibacterium casei]|uniref:Inosose dehydratase n=4 Tax=Brevibacterium casei TaxID=33889 RepID=A0A2H1IRJ4_9MICO|nr:TIM barrel protein [Brevibacterium casei]QPR39747.1 TIM barrel protein [Brevibacterium casei]QPR43911.1 TIM barrel protein [Brevibacterium casei]SMX77761.1 inosose dehydratase [Brevibacterium casei CIP 102111]VEW15507.1 Inosose dehydratase [Brevibacterium casei]
MTDVKIAAAPISWGVCEVPGWGYQLEPERVLTEMQELGFDATEFGPEGFLPDDPEARAEVLREHAMRSVGGFVPAVIHDPQVDPLPQIEAELRSFVTAGADTLVLAAATGVDGYDHIRPTLDEAGWETLCGNIDRIVSRAAADGIRVALHPHVGTMVETQDDVDHVLNGSSVDICFDTGHMFIGGIDPLAFVSDHPERISHVHLKDVALSHARRVRAGEVTYYEAVVDGMYRPLGQGDIDIRAIVTTLIGAGFDGWFTLEQDTVVAVAPKVGDGPMRQARESLDYLNSIVREDR